MTHSELVKYREMSVAATNRVDKVSAQRVQWITVIPRRGLCSSCAQLPRKHVVPLVYCTALCIHRSEFLDDRRGQRQLLIQLSQLLSATGSDTDQVVNRVTVKLPLRLCTIAWAYRGR